MPYNPRSRQNLVDMPALTVGEQTAVHRVRARKEVHNWLREMTAEQRGEMLAALYEQHGARESGVTPDLLTVSRCLGPCSRRVLSGVTPDYDALPKSLRDVVDLLRAGLTAEKGFGDSRGRWVIEGKLSGRAVYLELRKGELTKLVKAGLAVEQRGVYRAAAELAPRLEQRPAPELVKVVGKLGLRVLAVIEAGGALTWEPQPNGDTAAILWHTDGKKQRVSPETVAKLEAAGLGVPSLPK